MKFFFDNCLSSYLAEAVRALEGRYQIEHLTKRFNQKTPDVEWISRLVEEGDWVIVSSDHRITRSPNEWKAWSESGLTAFFFVGKFANMNRWKQAECLFRWWPEITQEAREHRHGKEGSGYAVPATGKAFKVLER